MQLEMLTKPEAERLVLRRLQSRFPSAQLKLAEATPTERHFGWVFLVMVTAAALNSDSNHSIPRMVIVNKYSAQVVASSVDYRIEEFVKRYEKLLAYNQIDKLKWCGTAGLPTPWGWWRRRTVAEHAKEGGFYEIRGKEETV